MHRFASVAGAAAFVAAVSWAQPASTVPQPTITEAEFLSVLTDDHPAAVAAREAVAQARAEARRAGTLANPQLSLTREAPSGLSDQIDLTFSWQPPHPSRGAVVASAERGVAAAEARLVAEGLELRLAMREAFATWVVTTELVERLAEPVRTVGDLARRERHRAQSGEASGLDAGRLELAAAELESQQALLESEALAAAATARGWNPTMSPLARPSLSSLPPIPADVAAAHPGLTALEEEVAAARLARQSAAHILALPAVIAGWQRVDTGSQSLGGPIVGLSWSLPWADRNRPGRDLAEARLEAATARSEAAKLQIGTGRIGALAAYQRLVTAVADARAANAANPQIVAATTAAFGAGEATLTDLLDTVRSVQAAESSTLRLHAAALAAHRRLEQLAGRPLDLE